METIKKALEGIAVGAFIGAASEKITTTINESSITGNIVSSAVYGRKLDTVLALVLQTGIIGMACASVSNMADFYDVDFVAVALFGLALTATTPSIGRRLNSIMTYVGLGSTESTTTAVTIAAVDANSSS